MLTTKSGNQCSVDIIYGVIAVLKKCMFKWKILRIIGIRKVKTLRQLLNCGDLFF